MKVLPTQWVMNARLALLGSKGVSTGVALCQRVQQGLRFLQVEGVKALGEPAVDRRQQLVGFRTPVLLLPQARQAHSGAQFQGLGLLAAGDLQGALEAGFRLLWLWHRLPQEQDAPLATDLRFPPAFLL